MSFADIDGVATSFDGESVDAYGAVYVNLDASYGSGAGMSARRMSSLRAPSQRAMKMQGMPMSQARSSHSFAPLGRARFGTGEAPMGAPMVQGYAPLRRVNPPLKKRNL